MNCIPSIVFVLDLRSPVLLVLQTEIHCAWSLLSRNWRARQDESENWCIRLWDQKSGGADLRRNRNLRILDQIEVLALLRAMMRSG